jgi:Uri superfamily endonuclease
MQYLTDNTPHFASQTGGSYILLINLPEEETITIGRLPARHFHQGYYAYVGSALNGLKARLEHHLRENKKLHWHIDYLLKKASITCIIACESEYRVECIIAQALSRQFDSIPGFGSSDCHCKSHLFFNTDDKKMISAIMSTIKEMGLQPRLW